MKSKICRRCKAGTLQESTKVRKYHPNKQLVEVELVESHCETCEAVSVSSIQHSENLRRLAARKAEYGEQLMGEEYVALRKRYGLTQRQASKIFGKGLIAFSRYENEETYPDASTRLLIEIAIAQPQILKTLAYKAGVEIPLWAERVKDEEKAKAKAEAAAIEPKVSEDIPRNIGVSEQEDDVWFAATPIDITPYDILYNNLEHHMVRKNSSLKWKAPRFDIARIQCSAGLSMLNGEWHPPSESQRFVFKEESFSPFAGAVGIEEDAFGEAA